MPLLRGNNPEDSSVFFDSGSIFRVYIYYIDSSPFPYHAIRSEKHCLNTCSCSNLVLLSLLAKIIVYSQNSIILTCSPEYAYNGHFRAQLGRLFGRLAVLVRDADVGVVFQERPHAFYVTAAGGQVHRSVATVGAAIDMVVPGSDEEIVENLVMAARDSFVERSVAEDSLAVCKALVQRNFVRKLDHKFDDFVEFA